MSRTCRVPAPRCRKITLTRTASNAHLRAMAGPPPQPHHGQVQHQTVVVADTPTAPVHGLFQPYFPLSHAELLRLQSTSTLWNGLGASIITVAFTYGLRLLVAQLQSGPKMESRDWWITGGGIVIGVVCLVIARIVSSPRRAVLRRIEKHFADNPGQQEFRMG